MTVTKKLDKTLRILTIVLGIATVLAMSHVYALLMPAQAAALSDISDTLTTSAPGASADHAIAFTMPTTPGATYDDSGTDQWNIYFDDNTEGGNPSGTEEFDVSGVVAADITLAGTSGTNSVADDCTGTEGWALTATATRLQFDVCSGDGGAFAGSDNVTVDITGITNPTPTGSYPITITFDDEAAGGDWEDEGETRVMILDQVTMTAEVETNLTCYVAGLADGAGSDGAVNGKTLFSDSSGTGPDGSASATEIDFGVITPDDNSSGETATDIEALGQRLEVATNASNGFLWTIEADQRLTSAIGADIDLFADDAATATPSDWTSPTGTLAATETGWGHLGLTSEDDNLQADTLNDPADDYTDSGGGNGSCETGTDEGCWVGNYLTARNVFAHTGPADGDGAGGGTANEGLTEIAWAVEISSLQEAAADYNNTWTHICTPTF